MISIRDIFQNKDVFPNLRQRLVNLCVALNARADAIRLSANFSNHNFVRGSSSESASYEEKIKNIIDLCSNKDIAGLLSEQELTNFRIHFVQNVFNIDNQSLGTEYAFNNLDEHDLIELEHKFIKFEEYIYDFLKHISKIENLIKYFDELDLKFVEAQELKYLHENFTALEVGLKAYYLPKITDGINYVQKIKNALSVREQLGLISFPNYELQEGFRTCIQELKLIPQRAAEFISWCDKNNFTIPLLTNVSRKMMRLMGSSGNINFSEFTNEQLLSILNYNPIQYTKLIKTNPEIKELYYNQILEGRGDINFHSKKIESICADIAWRAGPNLSKIIYKFLNKFSPNAVFFISTYSDRMADLLALLNEKRPLDINFFESEKFVKLQQSLKNMLDSNFKDWDMTVRVISEVEVKNIEHLISLLKKSLTFLRMLHNNDFDANIEIVKSLLLTVIKSDWDLSQNLTYRLINLALNHKLDESLKNDYNKVREGAEYFSINLDQVKQDLFSIRNIIANGEKIPFSWKNKIIELESDIFKLNNLLVIMDLKLNNEIEPKNPKLFTLNYQIGPYRFEVLPDRSVEHFQVGAATQCCQSIGGAGENAAIDSFINSEAGVLVLRYQNSIVAQSYFHYVPQDNGFILDNVETNDNLVKSLKINLNNLYANLAARLKEEYHITYFRCGTSYNKLDNKAFKNNKLPEDPRKFSVEEPYSDFDKEDHIDLLQPAFPMTPEDFEPIKRTAQKAIEKLVAPIDSVHGLYRASTLLYLLSQ